MAAGRSADVRFGLAVATAATGKQHHASLNHPIGRRPRRPQPSRSAPPERLSDPAGTVGLRLSPVLTDGRCRGAAARTRGRDASLTKPQRDPTIAITESDRHRLHEALIASLGAEEAATLMEHLPPIGWADVATKTDLDHLRETTALEFAAVRSSMDLLTFQLRTEIAVQFKEAHSSTVKAMFAFTSVSTSVLGLLMAFFSQ